MRPRNFASKLNLRVGLQRAPPYKNPSMPIPQPCSRCRSSRSDAASSSQHPAAQWGVGSEMTRVAGEIARTRVGHRPRPPQTRCDCNNGTARQTWPHKSAQPSSALTGTPAQADRANEMTFNTSEVAVCCSSDCLSSLSSRAFSMAMTACRAKFSTSSICLSVNGLTSCR